MVDFVISLAHNQARQQATISFADTGANPSRIEFYDDADVLLAVATLAKPCGVIEGGYIRLAQAVVTGDMITVDGSAVRAQWISGTNQLVASGSATDETGEGPFIIQGASGTQLYAGGRLILGITEIE